MLFAKYRKLILIVPIGTVVYYFIFYPLDIRLLSYLFILLIDMMCIVLCEINRYL